ncbi:MAG: DUF1015 domain-containing protein [Deltaproteobacteria bacterium]|nr:DUF1015 domain-containing protein [Deltaproteobacteria bacterium]
MPKIIPHKALVYGSKYRSHLGELVSPPYDVISTEYFQKLKSQNEFNSVRLCLAENSEDSDRYQKMAKLLLDWKEKKVLETLDKPHFYLIEERFKTASGQHQRLGFVGLLEVSKFDKKEILPHEFTLAGPKKDRLELLKTMKAELSQIFFCYQDQNLALNKIFESKSKTSPFMEGEDPQGVYRKLWLITETSEIETLQKLMQSQSLLIADGHHRYETAVHFNETENSRNSKYVQGYFTNLDAPGFSILPIHRLFSLPQEMKIEDFISKLKQNYTLEAFKPGLDFDELTKVQNSSEVQLLFKSFHDENVYLLKANKNSADDAEIFSIHKNIFEKILKWDVTQLAKGIIHYEHETEDFKKTFQKLPRAVGLFLPSTDLKLVMDLAKRGERMPQKSTFFFPKLASGLVNYELGSY